MTRRFFLILGFALFMLGHTSCITEDSFCTDHDECQPGFYCVEGSCVENNSESYEPDDKDKSNEKEHSIDDDLYQADPDKDEDENIFPEEDNDPCKPNDCLIIYGSTGSCTPDGDDFNCECYDEFFWESTAKECLRNNPCDSSPCGDVECKAELDEEGNFSGKYDCLCENEQVYHEPLKKCGKIIFYDDFENEPPDTNWVLNGDWEVGQPNYTGPTLDINPFHEYGYITSAYKGNNVLATKLKDNYGKSRNDDAVIDRTFYLEEGDMLFFSFKAYAHTERLSQAGGYRNVDGASLLVGHDTEFKTVQLESPDSNLAGTYCIGSTCSFQGIRGYGEDNTYGSFFGSMMIEDGGEKTIKFKFRSDSANQDAGVYIDDFMVYIITGDYKNNDDDYEWDDEDYEENDDDEYPDE